MSRDEKHDIEVRLDEGTRLLVSRQGRGALLVQIGIKRGEGWEWNFARLPRRVVNRIVALAKENP